MDCLCVCVCVCVYCKFVREIWSRYMQACLCVLREKATFWHINWLFFVLCFFRFYLISVCSVRWWGCLYVCVFTSYRKSLAGCWSQVLWHVTVTTADTQKHMALLWLHMEFREKEEFLPSLRKNLLTLNFGMHHFWSFMSCSTSCCETCVVTMLWYINSLDVTMSLWEVGSMLVLNPKGDVYMSREMLSLPEKPIYFTNEMVNCVGRYMCSQHRTVTISDFPIRIIVAKTIHNDAVIQICIYVSCLFCLFFWHMNCTLNTNVEKCGVTFFSNTSSTFSWLFVLFWQFSFGPICKQTICNRIYG